MPDESAATSLRPPGTTDDALQLFLPGQKISLRPLDLDLPEVGFTICKLSTPVTKSVVVLAKSDVGNPGQVVIKLFDPRYLDERIATIPSHQSYPWNLSNERAAARAHSQNPKLTDEELVERIYSDEPGELSGEAFTDHCLLWEERFHRLMMDCYDAEHKAYEHLQDLQGSVIPRLVMAGHFLPPDERAIRPPALVLEYIPSVSLHDVPFTAITPAVCTELLSAIESFPSYGVVHNDITMTNIRFTPQEQPVKGVVIDFGCAVIREECDYDEEDWVALGTSDVRWARRLLQEEDLRRSYTDGRTRGFG